MIRKKLLILDDNGSFAESLSDVLSQQGFDVQWAAQAGRARALAAAFSPDVLIVDVNLVTASGIEVAQQFVRERLARAVVFLTGSVDLDQSDIPDELRPISQVLLKPVEKEDLLHAIATLATNGAGVGKASDSTTSRHS